MCLGRGASACAPQGGLPQDGMRRAHDVVQQCAL